MRPYLISYDISHSKRRKAVLDIILRFGKRIQYSVFLAHLTTEQLQLLQHQILPLLDTSCDRCLISPCAETILSLGIPLTEGSSLF